MDVVNVMKSSVISGICIGIAGIGFLATRDIVGSVLFAFALLTVVAYKLKLYTGTAGFIKKGEFAVSDVGICRECVRLPPDVVVGSFVAAPITRIGSEYIGRPFGYGAVSRRFAFHCLWFYHDYFGNLCPQGK